MKYTDIDPEKLKITGNRILVRRDKPVKEEAFEERASGVLAPKVMEGDTDKDPGNIWEVVASGPDVVEKRIFSKVFLIIQPFAGFAFSLGDYDYSIISEQDVLAVV